jgi:hypothetical protein
MLRMGEKQQARRQSKSPRYDEKTRRRGECTGRAA